MLGLVIMGQPAGTGWMHTTDTCKHHQGGPVETYRDRDAQLLHDAAHDRVDLGADDDRSSRILTRLLEVDDDLRGRNAHDSKRLIG